MCLTTARHDKVDYFSTLPLKKKKTEQNKMTWKLTINEWKQNLG